MSEQLTKRERIARPRLSPDAWRKCSKCKRYLEQGAFVRSSTSFDGLHPHCRECRSAARKLAYANSQAQHAEAHRLKTYGLDAAAFDALVEKQSNLCAICFEGMGVGRNRHVDHDHTTGRVRELLCTRCNQGLGYGRHDPHILRAMAAYIERHEISEDRPSGG